MVEHQWDRLVQVRIHMEVFTSMVYTTGNSSTSTGNYDIIRVHERYTCGTRAVHVRYTYGTRAYSLQVTYGLL